MEYTRNYGKQCLCRGCIAVFGIYNSEIIISISIRINHNIFMVLYITFTDIVFSWTFTRWRTLFYAYVISTNYYSAARSLLLDTVTISLEMPYANRIFPVPTTSTRSSLHLFGGLPTLSLESDIRQNDKSNNIVNHLEPICYDSFYCEAHRSDCQSCDCVQLRRLIGKR